MQDYSFGKVLGSGHYGCVREALAPDGTRVAIKTVEESKVKRWCITGGPGWKRRTRIPTEVAVMKSLEGVDGVVHLREYRRCGTRHHLVMDRPPGTLDLFNHLEGREDKRLPEEEARRVVGGVLGTLLKVHRAGVLYRDVKEENVLVRPDTLQTWLVDFGVSSRRREGGATTRKFVGSEFCKPPELFLTGRYDPERAEVWALGVMTYNVLTGQELFCNAAEIVGRRAVPPEWLSEEGVHFMERALEKDPSERAKLEELVSMPWAIVGN